MLPSVLLEIFSLTKPLPAPMQTRTVETPMIVLRSSALQSCLLVVRMQIRQPSFPSFLTYSEQSPTVLPALQAHQLSVQQLVLLHAGLQPQAICLLPPVSEQLHQLAGRLEA